MTWQRIDENTFIDDTLVTCAEYQLFIDEMREQGKYHQPDHWNSYQFSEGQARQPILGVRYSDTTVFCDWLTKRDDGLWKFRLPNYKEAKSFPAQLGKQNLQGYWIVGENNQAQFAWVVADPIGARALSLDDVLSKSQNLFARSTLARDLVIVLNRDLSADSINALARFLTRARSKEFIQLRGIDRARFYARTLLNFLELAVLFVLAKIPKFTPSRFFSFDRVAERSRSLNYDVETSMNSAISSDFYADIIMLRERIAGRSPAFEGIRLSSRSGYDNAAH